MLDAVIDFELVLDTDADTEIVTETDDVLEIDAVILSDDVLEAVIDAGGVGDGDGQPCVIGAEE